MQSDFGVEFRSFTENLTELGVVHGLTCSHTSHLNGYVERNHKQIVEIRLTFLSHVFILLPY